MFIVMFTVAYSEPGESCSVVTYIYIYSNLGQGLSSDLFPSDFHGKAFVHSSLISCLPHA